MAKDRAIATVHLRRCGAGERQFLSRERARDLYPVEASDSDRLWVVEGYELAKAVLVNNKFSRLPPDDLALASEHEAFRRAIAPFLAGKAIEHLASSTVAEANTLVRRALSAGSVDLVGGYALPLVGHALFELVGIPVADRVKIGELVLNLPPATVRRETSGNNNDALHELRAYLFREARSGAAGALGVLVDKADDAGSVRVKIDWILKMICAGFEPTANLISSALFQLVRSAEKWDSIASRDISTNWIYEFARFDTPVFPGISRTANGDVMIFGDEISSGDVLIVDLAACNWDPNQFSNPEQLQLDRVHERNLCFGHGRHQCPGEALALQTASIALKELTKQTIVTGGRELKDAGTWSAQRVRALLTLQVELTPRPPGPDLGCSRSMV